jgi:hypothetical protein
MADVRVQDRQFAVANMRPWRFFVWHKCGGVDEGILPEWPSQWARKEQDLSACQILLVSRSAAKRYDKTLNAVKNSITLTIGEDANFLQAGGMLSLQSDRAGVLFDVNLDAVNELRGAWRMAIHPGGPGASGRHALRRHSTRLRLCDELPLRDHERCAVGGHAGAHNQKQEREA